MLPAPTVPTTLVALGLLLVSCQREIELEQQGLFVLANDSGHALTLRVFNTQQRAPAPLVVAVAAGGRVERVAYGGAGAIEAPELVSRGDSVRVVFADGKQALHYCPQLAQGNLQCEPDTGVLNLSTNQQEPVSKNVNRWTYTFTPAEYTRAR